MIDMVTSFIDRTRIRATIRVRYTAKSMHVSFFFRRIVERKRRAFTILQNTFSIPREIEQVLFFTLRNA